MGRKNKGFPRIVSSHAKATKGRRMIADSDFEHKAAKNAKPVSVRPNHFKPLQKKTKATKSGNVGSGTV